MLNFRPTNAVDKVPAEQVEETKAALNDAYQLANIDSHQCLTFDNFILVKCDQGFELKPDTIVHVKNQKKPKKDMCLEFDIELQSTMKEIEQDLKLYNYQMAEIKKDIEKAETQFKEMELDKKLAYLKDLAQKIKLGYDLDKVYNNFMKKYQALYESLNDNLLELDIKEREEIIIALEQLEKVIDEYEEKLKPE